MTPMRKSSVGKQMTKEYRLRKAVASLLESLESHGDHRAAWNALQAVNPDVASRLAKACADSETVAGMLLGMGMSADTEFSLLDQFLIGNPQEELPKMERWMAQLQRLQLKFSSPHQA